jgi:antibiotic biosynthesis monooxygenase (ABM) superfamily enzyme
MSKKKSRLTKWFNRKFSNRKPKEWKTRKIAFMGVLLVWIIVIAIGFICNWFGKELNDTLIDNIFSAGKWVIATGCSIVIAGNVTDCIKNKGQEEDEEDE